MQCPVLQVLRDGHVTPASDVYSFAILLYEMYTRKHLFKGMMHSQVTRLSCLLKSNSVLYVLVHLEAHNPEQVCFAAR